MPIDDAQPRGHATAATDAARRGSRASKAPRSRLSRALVSSSRRVWTLGVASTVCGVAASACALVAALSLVDAAVRFPRAIRMAALAALVATVVILARRRILPAWRRRTTPVELALRVERMHPALVGRLASAVEFDLAGTVESSPLAARALRDAEARAEGVRIGRVVRHGPALRRIATLGVLVASLAVIATTWPDAARIAAARILAPWSDARWPARTEVTPLVDDGAVFAIGRPVPLRAKLARGDSPRERVRAAYRVVDPDGTPGEWTEVMLARQPDGVFERLVEPAVAGATGGLEVRFLASDSESAVARARLVEPVRVVSAALAASPPAYAVGAVDPVSLAFGSGLDARSVLRDPVLAGSEVRLSLELSRPTGQGMVDRISLQGRDVSQDGVEVGLESSDWSIDESDPLRPVVRFVPRRSCRIEVDLEDVDGIRPDDRSVFVIEVTDDRAPSAAIEAPELDESVVPDARIGVRALARDDVGLRAAGVEIEVRVDGAPTGSVLEQSAATAATADDGSVPGQVFDRREVTTAFVLDVSGVGARAGDLIALRAFAEDAFVQDATAGTGSGEVAAGTGHGRVRSAVRVLRVVDDEEFERQIRTALGGIRRDAMRLDERQARAREAVEADEVDEEHGADPEGMASRGDPLEAQGSVTDGAGRMRELAEEVVERLRRNGRAEGVVGELAEQARELASAAEARSAEAGDALTTASEAREAGDEESRARAQAEAVERQDEVRAELEDLVTLLDRDQDAWIARRRVEALAGRVRQLLRETEQAARRSAGESREELSPDARSEIDALADRQRQAASEAEQVAAELRERAEGLEQSDSSQSKALEDAARSMEEGEVREELERAAGESEENRLERARAAQERAAAALSRAVEALSQDRKLRAKELARALEELVDSVRRLLEQTISRRGELAVVADGDDETDRIAREPLALGLGLLSQNTRGLAADARTRSREAARVVRHLERAATSLSGSATSLRARPFRRGEATDALEAAIGSLEDALVEAEKAAERAEERADEEKRVELLARYREALEQEVGLRQRVDAIAVDGDESLSRRSLVESRRLGSVQEEVRLSVSRILEEEEDVQGSDALVEMHDLVDSSLSEAKSALAGGRPSVALPAVESAIEALATIVAALDDSGDENDEDPFGEEGGEQAGAGEGSGGSPAGAVPPVAEIKILLGMQAALMKRTRLLDEAGSSMTEEERLRRTAEVAMKQERILDLGERIAEKIAPRGGAALRPDDADGQDGADDSQELDHPREAAPVSSGALGNRRMPRRSLSDAGTGGRHEV